MAADNIVENSRDHNHVVPILTDVIVVICWTPNYWLLHDL